MKGNCHAQLKSEDLKSENECVAFEILLNLAFQNSNGLQIGQPLSKKYYAPL